MNTNYPWTDPNNYRRTHKKKYTIVASMPPEGTEVTNFLENAHYTTSNEKQFVLTGTVGEQWVIDVNKLCKTYTFEDGTPITKDALAKKVMAGYKDCAKYPCIKPFAVTSIPGVDNWAIHIPLGYTFPIQTSWGDTLICNAPGIRHGKGDYIVCSDNNGAPNLSDMWIVNGAVFPNTYDMRAFPNMSSSEPNYELSRFEHKHPEFNGVTWNAIHSIASTAGKLHMENKGKSEMYTLYKEDASKICLYVQKKYPGKFGKPKIGMNKNIVFIPHSKMGLKKKGIEISFDTANSMNIAIYSGNKDNTADNYSVSLNGFNINEVAECIEASIFEFKL